MKKNKLRVLALGGLFGPILFILATIVSAALRTEYNHLHNFISALGASETKNPQLMNLAGFIPSGLLIALFGISMLLYLPKSIISRIGSIFVMAFGFGMTLAGIYSCDVNCFDDVTSESIIHAKIAENMFPLVILGILLLGISFRKQVDLKKFTVFFSSNSIYSNNFYGSYDKLFRNKTLYRFMATTPSTNYIYLDVNSRTTYV